MADTNISIVIIDKSDRGIANTLLALSKQVKDDHEIIVVDASPNRELDDIASKFSKVIWHYFDQKGAGFTIPAQRNKGVELSRGKIIAFIDANCVPSSGWLAAIESAIGLGEKLVCGPVVDANPTNLVHYIVDHDKPVYVDECPTLNLAITREVFDTIGGFDTNFIYGSDIDFTWRARDAGFKILYDPKVKISHNWGDAKEQRRRAFAYGRARAMLYYKHYRRHWRFILTHDPHALVYPIYIVGLPLTIIWPWFPLLIFIPIIKNIRQNPIGLISHHLIYGLGELSALKIIIRKLI